MAEWLDQHPERSCPDWCLVCGRPNEMSEPLLPVEIERACPTWLHLDCWEGWYAGRRASAAAALAAMDISDRRILP